MGLHVAHVTLMIIFISSVSLASHKPWPDFTCLPNNHPETEQKENVDWNESQWTECKYPRLDGKTDCVKACILGSNSMFSHGNDKNGAEGDITTFMNYLADQNGYEKGAGGEQAKKTMDKVREGLKKCVKDHPELKNLKTDDPCPKWDPFLSCMDKAIGC